MSSIYATDDTSNYFDYYFSSSNNSSSSSSSNSSSGTSSLFSSLSSSLGDYAMIKSGSYAKLMKAYYNTLDEIGENSDSTGSLINVKSDASYLKEALDALNNSKLYEAKEDEDGNLVYDTEGIKKALQNFVDSYNSYLDSASSVDNTSILSKTLSMVNNTSSSASTLKQLGITIGSDNKLSFDEDVFDELDGATAAAVTQSLFNSGSNSYGDMISQRASAAYQLANSAAYTNTRASSYTFDGTYSLLGTMNGINQYL